MLNATQSSVHWAASSFNAVFTKKAADFAIYASSFAWSYLIDRKHNVSVLKTLQWYMIKYNHVNYANNTSLKIYIGYTLV